MQTLADSMCGYQDHLRAGWGSTVVGDSLELKTEGLCWARCCSGRAFAAVGGEIFDYVAKMFAFSQHARGLVTMT